MTAKSEQMLTIFGASIKMTSCPLRVAYIPFIPLSSCPRTMYRYFGLSGRNGKATIDKRVRRANSPSR
jgi:hypothetical protein